jgi:hypothetical protein
LLLPHQGLHVVNCFAVRVTFCDAVSGRGCYIAPGEGVVVLGRLVQHNKPAAGR